MKDPRAYVDYHHWKTDTRVTIEYGNHVWTYVYVSYKFEVPKSDEVVWEKWNERARFRYVSEAEVFVIALLEDLEKSGYSNIEVHIKQ